MKNKNNAELLQYQQDKLKNQDNQIDDIIADVAKGKQMGKAIHGKLQDQNVLLEQIDENMDKLDSKMERTKKKFLRCVVKLNLRKMIKLHQHH